MIAYWLQEVYFATAHLTLCEVYMFEQPGHTNYHPSRKMAAIGKYKLLDSSFFRNSNRFCLLQTRMCANFHISATHKYEQVTVTLFPDVHCVCSTGVQKNVDLHCWQYCVPVVQWFPESRGQCNDDGGIRSDVVGATLGGNAAILKKMTTHQSHLISPKVFLVAMGFRLQTSREAYFLRVSRL